MIYPEAKKLRAHFAKTDIFEFEGVELKRSNSKLEPGDSYLAARNKEPQFLTVKEVKIGCVYPVEDAYPYDLHECYKVEVQ